LGIGSPGVGGGSEDYWSLIGGFSNSGVCFGGSLRVWESNLAVEERESSETIFRFEFRGEGGRGEVDGFGW